MYKMIWILLIVNNQFLIKCNPYREIEERNLIPHEYSRENLSRADLEYIKACNIKLDNCLDKCNAEYWDFNPRDTSISNCKELCITRMKADERCMIYFQFTRIKMYRSRITP